jgi:hypothetical protein
VSGAGCQVSGVGCWVSGAGCRVSGVRYRGKTSVPAFMNMTTLLFLWIRISADAVK